MTLVVPYDPSWKHMFEEEKEIIQSAVGGNCLAVYHVGSTSIEGLSAKPCIDIIVEVLDPKETFLPLEKVGYDFRGEFNIPFKFFFNKKMPRDINLHLYQEGHPEIKRNLMFCEYLRSHPKARDAYGALKIDLAAQESLNQKNKFGMKAYTTKKYAFIEDVIEKTGFDEPSVRFVMADEEWQAFHAIRKKQIFDRADRVYDPNHPSLNNDKARFWVLYKGAKIIGEAHFEFFDEKCAVLRTLSLDTPWQNKGYGSFFLDLIEKWLKKEGVKKIYLHASPKAYTFYKRSGYHEEPFPDDDVSINKQAIDMGKDL